MKLYCVRHGEAESADLDPQRPLTANGRADVEKIANHMRRVQIELIHVMHSPKLRAQQTAEIFAGILQSEHINVCDSILNAEAPVQPLVDMVQSWSEDTLIVGHLPFMYKFVSALVLNDENLFPIVNYPPGAVVCLEYYEASRWIIKWVLCPSIVS